MCRRLECSHYASLLRLKSRLFTGCIESETILHSSAYDKLWRRVPHTTMLSLAVNHPDIVDQTSGLGFQSHLLLQASLFPGQIAPSRICERDVRTVGVVDLDIWSWIGGWFLRLLMHALVCMGELCSPTCHPINIRLHCRSLHPHITNFPCQTLFAASRVTAQWICLLISVPHGM